jgi:hypothetical protein
MADLIFVAPVNSNWFRVFHSTHVGSGVLIDPIRPQELQ